MSIPSHAIRAWPDGNAWGTAAIFAVMGLLLPAVAAGLMLRAVVLPAETS